MRILDLAFKDIRQIIRDRKSLLFLVLMPVVFTLFMGFAYKSGTKTDAADARLPLGWVNNDPDGWLSSKLRGLLAASDTLRLVELTPDAAADSVRKGETAGALIVPAGFSARAAEGAVPQLTLLADTGTAGGQSLFQTLRAPVLALHASMEIARLSVDAAGGAGEFQPAFAAAEQAWAEAGSAGIVRTETAVRETKPWFGDNPYNQASPGILVQFAVFGLVTSGQILMQERKTRTLQRMLATAMQSWRIVAGHTLAILTVVLVQEALLVVFGQLALGVDYAREPLATLAVSVGVALWVAATGLLIGVLAKNDSQVILFSLMAMFLFSALGGTWFPLEATSGVFSIVGRLMPSAWAMAGYTNILIRGLGFESVWEPALILGLYAAGFFALAVWRFRKAAA
jgi:ABC-2 type transport system permease protein